MRISREKWAQLANLARAASKAVDELELQIMLASMDAKKQHHLAEAQLLMDLAQRLEEQGPGGLAYLLHPQTEWMGGDSMDPKNFKWREPYICPMPREYLP